MTLHGGPGYPSAYLEPLEALASDRPVVFYDQLGCGNSDRPEDVSLWSVERSVDELALLLDHLDLDDVYLLGHSWGTMLAVDFYLAHPETVRSMVLVSPSLSASRWSADCERLISRLPADLRAIHADPDATEEETDRLKAEFMNRYFLRLSDEPESVKRAKDGFGELVYTAMWGPNEFTATGVLKDYERASDLADIEVPVLYLCGRHDEATPEATHFYASLTPNAEVKVFENSAHNAFLEDTDEFIATVARFLAAS